MALTLLIILLSIITSEIHGIEIISDSLRVEESGILAEGNVKGVYGEYIIRAKRIRYIPETKEVFAYEEVEVIRKDGKLVIRGSYGYLNLENNTGYFLNVEGKLEKFYLSAKKVEQKGEREYEIVGAQLTTCPPEKKELKVCAGRARFNERYIYSLGNSLRFFNFPILYLPFALFPAGDRRSGLLLPMIGSNTYNSFIYRQPIYWAINRDKDMTLTFDIRDRQASGVELEYRQAFSESDKLFSSLSFYKEPSSPGIWWKGRDMLSFRENRYRVLFKLKKGNLKLGLDTVSDPFFLEDIYFSQKQRTIPYLLSYVSYTLENDVYLASLNLRRYQDLTYSKIRSAYVLPQMGVYFKKKKLKWLYFGLSAEYSHFESEGELKGHRLRLDPEVSLPFRFLSLNSLTTVRLINIFYRIDSDTYDKTVNTFSLQHRSFKFQRLTFGKLSLSNTFEGVYTFQPGEYNNPRFDRLDIVNRRNDISFRYRAALNYGDLVSVNLFLSGGYNYLGSYKFPTENKVIEKSWLPIRLITSINLKGNFLIYEDISYDPNLSILAKGVSSISYISDNYSLGLGLVNSKDSEGKPLSEQISLNGRFEGRRLFSSFRVNYDSREGKFLYREFQLGYKGSCWSLSFILKSTYYGLREDYVNEIYLGINVFDLKTLTIPISRN